MAALGCKLTVYINSTISTVSCFPPEFCSGVTSLPSPRGSPEVERTLNRTAPVKFSTVMSAMWPLVYFHGGRACNIKVESPIIRNVTLRYTLIENGPREPSQVRLEQSNFPLESAKPAATDGTQHGTWFDCICLPLAACWQSQQVDPNTFRIDWP